MIMGELSNVIGLVARGLKTSVPFVLGSSHDPLALGSISQSMGLLALVLRL